MSLVLISNPVLVVLVFVFKRLADVTLLAEAVLKYCIHALGVKRAKIHYYVSFPTKLFTFLIKVLPTWLMHKLLNKAGGGGEKQ